MTIVKRIISERPHVLLMAVFTAAMLALHQLVFLYGDDYFYGTFAQNGAAVFFDMHAEHYMTVNGRSVVHILASLLLIFDVYLWRLINPFIILLTLCFLSGVIHSRRPQITQRKGFAPVLAMSMGLFLLIDIYVARAGIYWLDGSMNYLYPIFMLSWTVYIFDKSLTDGKKHYFLPLLSFFAGATTEQGGLMTAGILLAVVISEVFNAKTKLGAPSGRKLKCVNYISLLCAFAGYISVAFAPGTFERWGIENAGLSVENIISAVNFFFIEVESALFIMLTMLSASFILNILAREIYAKNRCGIFRLFNYFVQACIYFWLLLYIIATENVIFTKNMFAFAVITPVCLMLLYVFALYFIIRGNVFPLAFFIAALGAQISMAVIPVPYHRTLLCSILAMILPITTAVSEINDSAVAKVFSAASLLCGAMSFALVFYGYAGNYTVNQYNLAQIKELQTDNSNERAILKMLPDDMYGWSPLHSSSYHIPHLERYYGLPADSVFIHFPEIFTRLYVNGDRLYTNVPPYYVENRGVYCISIRDISRAFDYSDNWDEGAGQVTIDTGEKRVRISAAAGEVTVDGNTIEGSEFVIFNYNSHFMIESDFYEKIFGFDIDISQRAGENEGVDLSIIA